MRLVDIENEIKFRIDADKNDPEIYNLMYDLCHKYYMRNKFLSCKEEASEVAGLMAHDMYMKLFDPTSPQISSYCGFIKSNYLFYIRVWRKRFKMEIIDTNGKNGLADTIVRMCSASSIDNQAYNNIFISDFVKNLPNLVDRCLEASNFYPYTKEWLNAKTSLLLSLANNGYVSYGLDEADSRYCNMLYRALCDEISVELRYEQDYSSFNILKLFALEDFSDQVEEIGGM